MQKQEILLVRSCKALKLSEPLVEDFHWLLITVHLVRLQLGVLLSIHVVDVLRPLHWLCRVIISQHEPNSTII